ncbi:oligosaccharide flippase family protein [Shewanella sp. 202IG2-18]|uniref:oligosaccharide flippase family protein n=1 Tax=Parashewanella hymeniacidonis TaxID=2807618 RepID=UPI00195F84E0|nr:oligosaccharide flippase family protein [Parashewanella hymeniacidonis]MBM7072101.1 oligosaccharide flippase family protein [Parashewanella hymeniacidonis]
MVKKVISNTFTYIIGTGVAQVFTLIFTLILMKHLSVGDYGRYNLIITFVAIFSFVIDGGLTGYIIKEFNNKNFQLNTPCTKRDELISNAYFYQFAVTTLLMITYTISVFAVVESSLIANYLTFGLLTLLLGLATPIFALLVANEKRYVIVIKDIITALFRLTLVFLIFKFSFSASMIYWIPSVALAVSIIVIFYFFKRIIKGFNGFSILDTASVINIFKAVTPFLILSIFNVVYNKIDVLMLNNLSTIDEVAFYAGATIFVYPFMFICSAASSAILPFFSRRTYGDVSARKDEQLIFIFMIVLGGTISTILFFSSQFLYTNLFGGKYLLSSEVYEILVWYLLIAFGYTSMSNALVGQGKINILIYMNITMLVLNVILNYKLIPLYGSRGAAFSTLVSEVVIMVFLWLFMKLRGLNRA